MTRHSRRDFLQSSAMGLAAAAALPSLTPVKEGYSPGIRFAIPFRLAITSYTFKEFGLDDVISMTLGLNIKNLSLKSYHMPLDSSPDQIREITGKVRGAGLNLYGGGVIDLKTEGEIENAFAYARMAGIKVIIGSPKPDLLGLVEEKVKEHDIRVAIHNHGPDQDVFQTPSDIMENISGMDPRLGICMDIGHTVRAGSKLLDETSRCFDRILDIHLKDVSEASAEGKPVEIGRGVIDIPSFLSLLIESGYPYMVSFEFEKNMDNPLPGLSESVGYIRGVLDVIKA